MSVFDGADGTRRPAGYSRPGTLAAGHVFALRLSGSQEVMTDNKGLSVTTCHESWQRGNLRPSRTRRRPALPPAARRRRTVLTLKHPRCVAVRLTTGGDRCRRPVSRREPGAGLSLCRRHAYGFVGAQMVVCGVSVKELARLHRVSYRRWRSIEDRGYRT